MRKRCGLLYFILVAIPASLSAQNKLSHTDEIKVFVDCNAWCDMSFVKTEITYVDFVPDRFLANVFIMITSQSTGSGGNEIKLFLSGQENFKGMEDTLKFYRSSVDTDAEYRENLVRFLKIGLTRFVAQTSLAKKLNISVPVSKNDQALNALSTKKDKWNFWVFNLGFSGNIESDDFSKSTRLSGRLRATRVTDKLKINLSANFFRSNTTYNIDGDISKFSNNNAGLYTTVVKSLNNHWSAGGYTGISHSTYSNYDFQFTFNPALEYSLFPYKEAVKKSITIFYRIGPQFNNYIDSGFYDSPEHIIFQHTLSLNVGFIQKWGNVNFNASWDNFLNSFSKDSIVFKGKNINTFSLGGNIEIRLVKGLTLELSSFANFTKGIYPNIPRKSFSRDDLLTRNRQYATQKGLSTYIGINYRFGSIYNNVVNPRFNGSFF